MVGEAADELGGLDVLVNNAGIQISRPSRRALQRGLRQGPGGQPARLVPVRPRGDPALPGRGASRASIINVSSVHQVIPKPDYLGYSVSKGGMQNLTRTLALEYAGRGIRVNGIGPGATVTPINRAWIDDPVKRAQVESHIPMARAGTADEMGARGVLPGLRRRGLHHRPDDLRRRRPDPVPELPRALVLGVSDGGRAGGPRLRRGRPARDAQPRGRGEAASRRSPSSARAGSTTSGTCSTRTIPVFPGRHFRQTLVTTAHHANEEGGVGDNDVNWVTEQVVGDDAARHAPRRALPPADRRPRLQRLSGRRAGRHRRRQARWASRPSRRSSRAAGSSTSPPRARGPGDVITPSDLRRHRPRARRRGAVPHRLGRALGRPGHLPLGRARPRLRAGRVARRARRRADRLRHLELRPGAGRGPRAAVRGARRPSTSATASSSSRTSTRPRWPPTACGGSR